MIFCYAQWSSKRLAQQLIETDAETHGQTFRRSSDILGVLGSVGARGAKDITGKPTESTDLGSHRVSQRLN